MRYCFLVTLVLVLALAQRAAGASVGTASILAPAVITTNNTGAMTLINLTVTDGNGNISVVGPSAVGSSTLKSAITAARYASGYLGLDFSSYNFSYYIHDMHENVSGPSAGAAMTLLAVSALSHRPLRTDFTITGTVSGDGSIGEIGGVYDKAAAATGAGLRLILVPSALSDSREAELYLLVQESFGIPLVQVSDIKGASYYAFNSSIDGAANATSIDLYTDYRTGSLPAARLACSNYCNMSTFKRLVNETFNYTELRISALGSDPRFAGIASQLGGVLNESIAVTRSNYWYVGANFAFLDYINAFFFSSHDVNTSGGLQTLLETQSYCSGLVAPALTADNYDYVFGGELRQAWANYTLNQTLANFNVTGFDTDSVLASMYNAAESGGWCRAASTIYSIEASQGPNVSAYVQPSQALSAVALARINRAKQYGSGMYLNTAKLAYRQGNFPLAILDADYAYVLPYASVSAGNMSTSNLTSAASALLGGATYGVWATAFAKEALFYINESGLEPSASLSRTYALQAYSSAMLAQQMSSDTSLIHENLLPTFAQSVSLDAVISRLDKLNNTVLVMAVVTLALFALNAAVIGLLLRERAARRRAARGRRRR